MNPILECSKVKFNNESSANLYIDKLKKTSTRIKVPRRAYLCEHCHCWHLTSSDKNEDSRIEKYKRENDRLGKIILQNNQKISEQKEKITQLNKIIEKLRK